MKPFLDANILVAILNKEYPMFTDCARILSLATRPGVELYTSPLCIAIAWFFAEKKVGRTRAGEKINLLMEKITVTDISATDIEASLRDRRIGDLEDGMEYFSAKRAGCTHIITQDTGDFHFASLPVRPPEAFLLEILGRIK